ncbi:NAD-dependent protein deacetylase hst4 [Cytospora mali]|uniref:NAD-dependent protein deacetylase hst4 n=1 Tax=Cytospora mali TaxID=578113 RepID=A0A194VQY2_CYTMA|nr:NAD-dependent protein deacetylase hst4 [Valsa mali]
MDPSSRYPSPSSTATQSSIISPSKRRDSEEIQVRTDGGPPAKRRKIAERKPRTTEFLELDNRDDVGDSQLDRLLNVLRRKKKIVVIAGAGISVSAGIPDFRSSEGLFKTLKDKHKIKGGGKSLFDASVYKDNKSTEEFHKMVRDLSRLTREAKPTAFHHMLATIAQEGRLMRLYSQNVDCLDTSLEPLATDIPLNTKAPWPVTIQLHGGLEKMQCTKCSHVDNFDGSLFQGPEPPLCERCKEADYVRTEFGGKRSHGIGRLRPRMVLYNEYNPDEDAIGKVSQADLRRVPDAVLVVGTSLKVPGVKRIVRELCQATRAKRDGFTAWINLDPAPQAPDMKNLWDLVVRGRCDDIAGLLNLPHWDCDTQDIGLQEEYMVSGSTEKEVEYEQRRNRDRIDVLLANRKGSFDQSSDVESRPGDIPDVKSKLVDKVQETLPTPSASPRQGTPQLRKPLPKGKAKQSKLSFGVQTAIAATEAKPAKASRTRKPRQAKKETKPKNALTTSFKTTKSGTKAGRTTKAALSPVKLEPNSPNPSSPPRNGKGLRKGLPSLRPESEQNDTFCYKLDNSSSSDLSDLSFTSAKSDWETIIPNSKPRGMENLVD